MKARFTPKTSAEIAEIHRIARILGDRSDYDIDAEDLATSSKAFTDKVTEAKQSDTIQKR